MRDQKLHKTMANEKNGSKYDQAVTRATTGGVPATGGQAPVKDIGAFLTKDMTPDQMQAVLDDPGMEFAPQIYKLEQNEMVRGILEGNGPDAEFERINPATGVSTTNTVQTWIIASPDGRKRISILSSVQLDRKLPPFVGSMVTICRGKDINIANGQRVTDYMVGGPKREDGKIRNWARPPVIEATGTETRQLEAGAPAQGEATAS